MVHLSVCRLWPYDMACRVNSGRHFFSRDRRRDSTHFPRRACRARLVPWLTRCGMCSCSHETGLDGICGGVALSRGHGGRCNWELECDSWKRTGPGTLYTQPAAARRELTGYPSCNANGAHMHAHRIALLRRGLSQGLADGLGGVCAGGGPAVVQKGGRLLDIEY